MPECRCKTIKNLDIFPLFGMVIAGDRVPGSLGTIVAEFHVPLGWDKAEGPNPHDALQKFLEERNLWSPQFLYGSAPVEQLQELISNGFARDQLLGKGLLKLVGMKGSRDYYCNSSFFTGQAVVAIYHQHMLISASPDQKLEGLGLRFNPPESRYALAAVVLPKVNLAAGLTRQDS